MRPLAGSTSLAAVLLASVLAKAQPSLVLTDGQTIKGNEIKRQGDTYYVTMEDGNTATFPVALVKEIKLVDDPRPTPPPGFDYSPARTLVGPKKLHSQDPKDQLRALGPPTRWTPNVIDPTWVPISAYDRDKDVLAPSRSTWSKSAVDTTWVPKSAYDQYRDVFAASRATWTQNVIDPTWEPHDSWGFKPLWPAAPGALGAPDYTTSGVASLPRAAEAPQAPAPVGSADPWTCADKLFATESAPSPSMTVKKLESPLYATLGVPLYEAEGKLEGASRKAVFTIAGDQCRLVGGDSDALIGLNLPAEHSMMQAGASLNAALAAAGNPGIPKGIDKIDYAFAFVALTDPSVSGSSHAELRIIGRPEEVRSIVAKTPNICVLPKAQRNKEQRTATSAYAMPKALAGPEGDVITFLTWSSAGGTFYKNTVVLSRGGAVSAKREPVATHVGQHRD
jgi:hypothetical protein